MVASGFIMDWRLAKVPTRRRLSLVKATTEGVTLSPSALTMITGLPDSIIATAELVVPKSIPTAFPITKHLLHIRDYQKSPLILTHTIPLCGYLTFLPP